MVPERDESVRQKTGTASGAQSAPAINLPKGGGAIRGIGEKFAANPVTGTGSMTVPIATSPGRFGFGPQIALAYDSGAGNGPFGSGWNLSLPAITRKTDKGLPQYRDAEESDVFLLSGAEDLVPVLNPDGSRFEDGNTVPDYTIYRYRPRIEGLFARIERWTRQSDGDVHWRSISKDNILTIYGKDIHSRIADPENPKSIFSWLICETRDDKGNAVLYEYKPEDGSGVNVSRPHECNRGDRNDPRRTANHYLKHIRYGNRASLLDNAGKRPRFLTDVQISSAGWMFQVVFDYGEHDENAPKPNDPGQWDFRDDPFSTYRAGFEIRTTRLCQRVLMFHHFPDEEGVGKDCLVRSTDFTYSHEQDPDSARNPVYTFLREVTQTGYKRDGSGYQKRKLPPIGFEYTQPDVQDTVEEVDPASLENLPIGVEGAAYQWADLHGEGIPGILTEQAGAWFYKRNISPISERSVEFTPLESVTVKPNLAFAGGAQFMDLAGDGQPDLVALDGPMPGLYEHDRDEGWQAYRPFTSRLNRDMRDPNLRFVDLDGNGHADVLITEDDAFVWHASLAEAGFDQARRVAQVLDEEKGPRLVFADGTQSIHLADLSGDGLTDLVRIRNREVCYWPNLGYGRFGAKVTMDHAPHFDDPDQFDHKRIRLADIDGTGTTDIIYLHRGGVHLYFNQSGNGWSEPQLLSSFPRVDDIVSIVPADLLGNGTACLVWSSPLTGDSQRPMRYVNLMGGQKPHLLVKTVNNLGAETRVRYAPSTKFYLQDKRDGKPWITRLPFPVHVVERVETYDHISRNRFVTRYAYHHGYFDGEEREFRGFGMVEQWDTEELAALTGDSTLPDATNIDAASHVPPVHTKTWFHTGVYLRRDHISDFFAGLLDANDKGEYFREPGLTNAQARDLLLADTVLPPGLTPQEEREACRALKGAMLRQEVFAQDGTPKATVPYTVTEQNYSIRCLQPRDGNRHAVFFTHPCEAITYHYERNPADPRIQHALTLEVDEFGNVLKEAAIGYGRRRPDAALPLDTDREKQTQTLITYTENGVTHAIDDAAAYPYDYRMPLPCETRTYELTGYTPSGATGRFVSGDFVQSNSSGVNLIHIHDGEIPYEGHPSSGRQRRLIEHLRTLYRKDELTALLPLGEVEPLALPGENYKLAFTPGLLTQVFQRDGQPLLSDPASVLGGQGADRGGYVVSQDLKAAGDFPDSDPDDHWWIPAGRIFLSPDKDHTPVQEQAYARDHFFLPQRYRGPFGNDTMVLYDGPSDPAKSRYDLLITRTIDALNNTVTAANDYRVLQPWLITDPNRNRTQVAFDVLGMVVGTAVMGKPEETLGDSLDGFSTDLSDAEILEHLTNPISDPQAILGHATTRLVYDLFAYQRTKHQSKPQPAVVYTLVRETHDADLSSGQQTKIQHSFSYSDGFGREIQKKIQAEPGPLVEGGPVVTPRWIGSGWTIFNNKGKPVRQYEPFFSATPSFEFGVRIGVSPVLFYDPIERVVATLHPNHTWEKVVFDPWRQVAWDVNDTVLVADPGSDPDVGDFFRRLPDADYLPTWHMQRQGGGMGAQEQAAADKAAAHAGTPTTVHFDSLGRPFITVAHNKVACPGHDLDGTEEKFHSRVELDIEGNQRTVRDAIEQNGDAQGRIVMRYDYDMLGNRIHQTSMEAGERWMVNDVAGSPIRAWDSRNHEFCTAYDQLRRPVESWMSEGGVAVLVEKNVYGETQPNSEANNLRGQVVQLFDQAGVVTSEDYDFKGNPLSSQRQLAREYKTNLDWSTAVPLETESYTSSTTYDTLNRPIQLIAPRSDQPGAKRNVIQHGYNESNLLERVDVWLDYPNAPAALLDAFTVPPSPVGVNNIDYDAKGQRLRIDYKNGAITHYNYDPQTFRLMHLYTRRGAEFAEDCGKEPPPPRFAAPDIPPADTPCGLQNIHYTYDPAGNITHIRDDAQQSIYFHNNCINPSNDYTYDALYRLIEARGREHLGQIGGAPIPHSYNDAPRVGLLHPGDCNAIGSYIERYVYDAVGNFLEMQHRGSNPNHPGWTRSYNYAESSLIEDGAGGSLIKTSNRLSRTVLNANGANPIQEVYVYDPHGNMLQLPQLQTMQWDYRDQLGMTQRQKVNEGDAEGIKRHGERTYYVYDVAGQRVRKVTELANGKLKDERVYLGGFEIYRQHSGSHAGVVRETLHIMDDQQRIALVESRTQGTDPAPAQLIRYQFGNHLGSSSLELDDQAQIISCEEYTPYGSSSFQAVRSRTETPKRYRYSGKERDEVSGFTYHGARYYAGWLGRWTSCDPLYLTNKAEDDGVHIRGQTEEAENVRNSARSINLYGYVNANPLLYIDIDGKDIYILVETHTDSIYLAGLLTRKKEIEQHVDFDKRSDKVFTISVYDLGLLNKAIEDLQLHELEQKGFGRAVELGVWGHAAIKHGPMGEHKTSGKYREDKKQLSIEGWEEIDFNWDPEKSIAMFYGCNSFEFATRFIKVHKNLKEAGGSITSTYPSRNKWRYKVRGIHQLVHQYANYASDSDIINAYAKRQIQLLKQGKGIGLWHVGTTPIKRRLSVDIYWFRIIDRAGNIRKTMDIGGTYSEPVEPKSREALQRYKKGPPPRCGPRCIGRWY